MRRRRRLPRTIEREFAKLLGTLGFKDYGDFLWNLDAAAVDASPVGVSAAVLGQIRDQARHDPAVVATGEAALPGLRRRTRDLLSLCGVSSAKLLDGVGVPPAVLVIAARLDPATVRQLTGLIEVLRPLGAATFTVVVTDEGERAAGDLSGMAGVRLLFWRDRFTGDERIAPRHLALLVHAIGAPVVVCLRSRFGLGMLGLYGRALENFHRLYAVLDVPDEGPFRDVHHLRQTAPHATVLAASFREAEVLRAHAVGLEGPGIAIWTEDPKRTFGGSFEDLRTPASRTVYAALLGRAPRGQAVPAATAAREDQVDLTVTIVFHRERELAVPALASLRDMIEVARRDGVRVEARAMLDNADDLTRRLVAERGTFLDDVREVAFGDLAKVRNAGTAAARGRFLAFVDGDDLWGDRWLLDGYRAAQAAPHAVWHPEVLFMFFASDCDRMPTPSTPENAWTMFLVQQSSEAAGFEPRDALFENRWSANALAARDIFERFPYRADDWPRQIGIEDWRWNLDTLGRGVAHLVVPDTVHLIRLKESGSLGRLHETRASLPLLD